MSTLNISGSIGYSYLSNGKIKVLILSDMHSKLPYCNNDGIFISDWLNKKYKSKVLLEEVPRTGSVLKELWPESPHTQKLKNLYLNSRVIDGIDIRPFLIPFSWELFLDNQIDKIKKDELSKIKLIEYLSLISKFFSLKHEYFIKNLGKIYTKEFLNYNDLGKHFLKLKEETKKYFSLHKSLLNETVYSLIEHKSNILERINEIISYIMEWYTVAKIFQGNLMGNDNFIIHAGLAHTSNINLILKKEYFFKVIDFNGLIDINDGNIESNGCLRLPSLIDNQFGGNFGIF